MHSIDDAVVERCVAFVRDIASGNWRGVTYAKISDMEAEARAIVALLPEPVDPDWIVAGELAKDLGWPVFERSGVFAGSGHELAFHAVKKGRELAARSSQGNGE